MCIKNYKMKPKYFTFSSFKSLIKKLLICFVPLLIPFTIFFFIKNIAIFKHKKIFLSYNWAFGHQVLSLEGISRIYGSKEKIALIEILSLPRNNPYLSKIYTKYFNIFQVSDYKIKHLAILNYFSFKITLNIVQKILNNFHIITYDNFMNEMSNYNHKNSYSTMKLIIKFNIVIIILGMMLFVKKK